MNIATFIATQSILILWLSSPIVAAQGDDEQAVRNEIQYQRGIVQNMIARVEQARGFLTEKQAAVAAIVNKRAELQGELERVESLLVTKRQAKELTERQLRRRIADLVKQLQTAADANRPSEQLVMIQKRTNRYRDQLKKIENRYNYKEQIAQLEDQQRDLLRQLEQIEESIVDPADDLELARDELNSEERLLAAARAKLSELMGSAGERLVDAQPPILKEVSVSGPSGVVYKAHWTPGVLELDIRTHNLKTLMREQQDMLHDREDQLEFWEENVLDYRRECDRMMENYQDAIWRQFWNVVVVELCDSALNICWDLKELGPYAVVLEAGDRVYKAGTGTAARSYEIPVGTSENKIFAATSGALKENAERNAIKSTITSVISTATTRPEAGEFLGYGNSGLRVTHDSGRLTNVGTAMSRIYNAAVNFPPSVRTGQIWDSMRNVNLSQKWNLMSSNIDQKIFQNPRGTGADFTKGFVRDQVQGVIIEEMLSGIEDERRRAWFDYANADTRRSVALANYKSTAAMYRIDRDILEVMQEVLDELIKERNEAKLRRTLYRTTDEVLDDGVEYTIRLTFFGRNVEVSSVAIAGVQVTKMESDGNTWSGKVQFEGMPSEARLAVDAIDADSQKRLDNPLTMARFVPETESWSGYEPGQDENHVLRIEPNAVQRSFVFLVDCSGSMGENEHMVQVKAAASQMFESGRFQKDDELALYVFKGGLISRQVGFTREHEAVRGAIQSLEVGGSTPLAAAIVESGSYLYAYGRGRERALIALTDGDDTEGGNVAAAVAAVRRMRQKVELGLQ